MIKELEDAAKASVANIQDPRLRQIMEKAMLKVQKAISEAYLEAMTEYYKEDLMSEFSFIVGGPIKDPNLN